MNESSPREISLGLYISLLFGIVVGLGVLGAVIARAIPQGAKFPLLP